LKPVRHRSAKEQWVFKNRFNSQRRRQKPEDNEKGMPQIEFEEPESYETIEVLSLDKAVTD